MTSKGQVLSQISLPEGFKSASAHSKYEASQNDGRIFFVGYDFVISYYAEIFQFCKAVISTQRKDNWLILARLYLVERWLDHHYCLIRFCDFILC